MISPHPFPLHYILLEDEILPHFLISVYPGGRIAYDTLFKNWLPIRCMHAYIQAGKADYHTMAALPAFYTVIIVIMNISLLHGYSQGYKYTCVYYP